jgi:hypothetical protein
MSALEPGRRRTPFIAPVTAIADWWRRQRDIRRSLDSLDRCGDKEVAHMASDLHLTTDELRAILRHAPDDAKLMRRRMAALELDPERLARRQPGVMRDLERLCSICPTKKRCVKELAQDPDNPAWREHCLNALTLSALQSGAPNH